MSGITARGPGSFLCVLSFAAAALGGCDGLDPFPPSLAARAAATSPNRQERPPPPRDNARRPSAPRGRGVEGEADKSRRDFGADCLRSGCHAQLGKTPWVHGPVAVGACDTCHAEKGKAEKHEFRLVRGEKELCTFCHRPPKPQKHVHKAYSDAECVACHAPHGGDTRAILQTTDEAELCGKCHDARAPKPPPGVESAAPFKFLHEPVAEGRCLACHTAHQSEHEGLLTASERGLCLGCHTEVGDSLKSAAHIHKPLETECRSCHASHGGEDRRLLRTDANDLCLGCHPDVRRIRESGAAVHGALLAEASCVQCHTSHVGSSKTLVAMPIDKACFGCHDRELELPSGRKVGDVKAEIDSAEFRHGPVEKGECQACHLAHSSPHRSLLTAEHPSEIYARYSKEAYALCFSCHDRRLVEEERTTLTRFRDGDRNLHHVHVHRQKGRTCGICHENHGSRRAGLTRESIAFGPRGWKLPIAFERTDRGGSCGPGCHQALSYDIGPAAGGSPAAGSDDVSK